VLRPGAACALFRLYLLEAQTSAQGHDAQDSMCRVQRKAQPMHLLPDTNAFLRSIQAGTLLVELLLPPERTLVSLCSKGLLTGPVNIAQAVV